MENSYLTVYTYTRTNRDYFRSKQINSRAGEETKRITNGEVERRFVKLKLN